MDTTALRVARPDGCGCGDARVDNRGNVLHFRTCPVCSRVILDIIRGAEYAIAHVKCGDTDRVVLLKQREFFSLQAVNGCQ